MLSVVSRPDPRAALSVLFCTKEQAREKSWSVPSPFAAAAAAARDAFRFEGARGEVLPVVHRERVLLVAGLGKAAELTGTALRIAARGVLLSAALRKAARVEFLLHDDTPAHAVALLEGIVIGGYRWRKYISLRKDDPTVFDKKMTLVTRHAREAAEALTVAQAVNGARDLVNDNADVVTPEFLTDTVRRMVRGNRAVTLEVLGRRELAAKKFGLVLAVNQGSNKEPRVVLAAYQGAGKDAPYTAVIGKGLTYDTGGLNLKPTGSMETMRQDMSGAAAVIGTLQAVLQLKPKKNILFAFGSVENAISADAYKPGDVFTSYSGRTVEIGNTDAEGRLVLADVIAYVARTRKPARMLDLATLTGACRVALAEDYAAVLGTDEVLVGDLLASARATDDRLWQLPLYPEARDAMKSKVADLRNTSAWKGAGGTITGAEFLRPFAEKIPWAHLDIANVAFVEGDSRWYYGHGATGFGVRLCVHYLLNH